jgi:trimeric autotransporter adhesin
MVVNIAIRYCCASLRSDVDADVDATLVAVSTRSTVAFGGTATLSTTGGSGTGAAVTFASNNANCTVVGSTLTAAGVGTCTVTATKAADTNYTAVTSAGIMITIAGAPQTITSVLRRR